MRRDKFGFFLALQMAKKKTRELPLKMANHSKRHFEKSWDKEGFTDTTTTKWQSRKSGGNGRRLLVKTGRLKNSLRAERTGAFKARVRTSGVPYARYHNDGTSKLPQRQFMGTSKQLDKELEKMIEQTISKIF